MRSAGQCFANENPLTLNAFFTGPGIALGDGHPPLISDHIRPDGDAAAVRGLAWWRAVARDRR